MDTSPSTANTFNLRDELFWFGKPRLLLWLIQLVSFQNAFEMATFIWSLWEIREPSCFMENRGFIIIRLTSGIILQFCVSYITFPLYVIIAQMGSKFKKTIVSENVRKSLHGWHRRVHAKSKQSGLPLAPSTRTSNASLDSMIDELPEIENATPINIMGSSSFPRSVFGAQGQIYKGPLGDEGMQISTGSGPIFDSYDDDDNDDDDDDGEKHELCLLPSRET